MVMPISLESLNLEAVKNTEWAEAAQKAGKGTAVCCIAIGILGIFFSKFWYSILTICIGCLISVWELPIIYSRIKACSVMNDVLNNKVWFRKTGVRAIIYVGLSLLLLTSTCLQILNGIFLLATGTMYVLAVAVGIYEIDGEAESSTQTGAGSGPPTGGASAFGTF